jgi:hypothetical protein
MHMVTSVSKEPVASILYPEDGVSRFCRNVADLLQDYSVLHIILFYPK